MKQSMLLILLVVAATVFSALTGSSSIPTIQENGVISGGEASEPREDACRHYRKRPGYHCR